MKNVKSMIIGALASNVGWKIAGSPLRRLASLSNTVGELRRVQADLDFYRKAAARISPSCVVRNGPFKGLRYPPTVTSPQNLALKLIGGYESELDSVVEEICRTGYSEVIDVGCAEGYYAVGLALRLPTAKVFAYDTELSARENCAALAALNKVSDRVKIDSWCDTEKLLAIGVTKRGLIISDCEGFELDLFPERAIPRLARFDILIECHDFIRLGITPELKRRFAATHTIRSIQSTDDIAKAYNYHYPELEGYTLDERRKLLAERRPVVMEWLFLKSKAEIA
jgi:hypothetical protein